jgi:serine/threonine protein kinase
MMLARMGASLESQPSVVTAAPVAAAGLGPGERNVVAGRYKLLDLIAQGGMGSVYRAEHKLSKKKLAVKVVFPHLCKGKQGVERFQREVSAAAEIDHPGIVQVYDAGTDDDGGFFMAMELLDGESLGDLLRRSWPGMASAVNIVVGMLEPLAKAHAKGFVHRDLKPDNVFLAKTESGERVKILDFGLVRDTSKRGATRTGTTFGTPEYMSPEQAMSARKVEPPGDVWSIGVMVYELLSGQHPFVGETPTAIMANAIKEPLTPLDQVAPHVPAALARFIDRCLEKNPDDRPQSAGQMLEELRAVLATVSLDETVPSMTTPPSSWDESEEPELEIGEPVAAAPSKAMPSDVVAAQKIERGGRRGIFIAVGALVALMVVSSVAVAIFLALPDPDPTVAANAVRARSPEVAAEVEPPAAATSEEVPSEIVAARVEAEPPTAEAQLEQSPAEPPQAAPTKRRVAREAPAEGAEDGAFEEASRCLARGDRRCARDVLEARGRSAAERALLIDTYRELGQTPQMLNAMESFVRRFPRAPQTARYREDLRRYGRL